MPKFRLKEPSDPYLKYLHLRQYGKTSYGVEDALQKRMGEDLLNMGAWRENRRNKQYYEFSDSPYYIKSNYVRTRVS